MAATSSPVRIFIKDLKPAQRIAGVYAVQNLQLGKTKTGGDYLKMVLADKSGRTPGRKWSSSGDEAASLPQDGFVYIEGQSQAYQGEVQIVVDFIQPHTPSREEMAALLPCTTKNINEMFSQLRALLGSLTHPAVRSLADRYLEDGQLMEAFCMAPAATSLHHAFLGGLLEHTLGLMEMAEKILPFYPQVNRDIVLMGLFLHDVGKCQELSWENGFAYTTDGQLVGHIARGAIMLAEKAKACQDAELGEGAMTVPAKILLALTHIVLSHHEKPEFGAAKIPSTPEAILVAHLDNMDAKMNMVLTAADRNNPKDGVAGEFTEKVWALETRIWRADPTK